MLWFVGLTVLWVLVYKFVPVPYTPLMAIRSIEGDDQFKLSHKWVPIEKYRLIFSWLLFVPKTNGLCTTTASIGKPSKKQFKAIEREKDFEEEVRFRSKPQKMFFYGRSEVG